MFCLGVLNSYIYIIVVINIVYLNTHSMINHNQEDELTKAFGRTLRKMRLKHDISLAEFANRTKLPVRSICAYENGLQAPKITTVLKLLDALPSSSPKHMLEILATRPGKK